MASLFMMSYYGAEKAIDVRARSESVGVHAISPGPVKTRAASGVDHFGEFLERAASRAPVNRLVNIEDVGLATAVLGTDHAKLITGETIHVDGGNLILG